MNTRVRAQESGDIHELLPISPLNVHGYVFSGYVVHEIGLLRSELQHGRRVLSNDSIHLGTAARTSHVSAIVDVQSLKKPLTVRRGLMWSRRGDTGPAEASRRLSGWMLKPNGDVSSSGPVHFAFRYCREFSLVSHLFSNRIQCCRRAPTQPGVCWHTLTNRGNEVNDDHKWYAKTNDILLVPGIPIPM